MIALSIRAGIGVLLALGVWVYAVRGEAILMDLRSMSAGMLCF